jgi:alkanesulfonate monooxygenase SsuD/methylene tetrahydromethanopterin reductase-like flavin-dependent oxidoreductase (luciferase family)
VKVRFAVSVGVGPPDPGSLASVCSAAEAKGFDTLWFSDVPTLPLTDPLVGAAFAAAVTQRVHLGVNFIPFGCEPYLAAHRLAQLDRLTGGRLLVTLVPGIDQRYPAGMMDEVVRELRRLWTGAGCLPVLPVQDPLEIWLGGSGPKAVERAGRLADGWLGSLVSSAHAGDIKRGIEEEAAAAGRSIDPEHFGLSIAYARHPDEVATALARAGRRSVPAELVPVGRDAVRRLVTDLVDKGLSKFVVRPLAPPVSWNEELDWLAGALLDLQT